MKEYINRQLKQENLDGKYVENLHYSFIEYGGSSISHLTCSNANLQPEDIRIKGVSNKPIIIADFDRESKHSVRRKKLGECYYYLPGVKEIENTIHEEILMRVIAEYEGVDTRNLILSDISSFTQQKYRNLPLGDFIDNQLGNNKKRRSSYSEGKTIRNKTDFAGKACKYLGDENISYENAMSKSAITLASRLVEFIIESNKNISNM